MNSSALTPLLGTGKYGSLVDPVDDIYLDWSFDGRELRVDNRNEPSETHLMIEVPAWQPLARIAAPIALLTSAVTSSSGEAVLISCLGRANTRTFGLPTAGLTTSNNLHVLMDGSRLLLAENMEADRNDKLYLGPIPVDETIPVDWGLISSPQDPVIRAAANWIRTRRPRWHDSHDKRPPA